MLNSINFQYREWVRATLHLHLINTLNWRKNSQILLDILLSPFDLQLKYLYMCLLRLHVFAKIWRL